MSIIKAYFSALCASSISQDVKNSFTSSFGFPGHSLEYLVNKCLLAWMDSLTSVAKVEPNQKINGHLFSLGVCELQFLWEINLLQLFSYSSSGARF